jgi:hypothetical protein
MGYSIGGSSHIKIYTKVAKAAIRAAVGARDEELSV